MGNKQTYASNQIAPDTCDKEIARAINIFGLRTGAALFKEQKNVVFCPLSAYIALCMTALGASNDTRAEMNKNLFAYVTNPDNSHVLMKEVVALFESQPEFAMGNKIWLLNGNAKPSYIQNLQNFYHSQVQTGGSLQDINSFVEEKTKGKIKEILKQLPEDAALVLVNANYFKASWLHPFDKQHTISETFYLANKQGKIQVPMMKVYNKTFYIGEHEKFTAVTLMYQKMEWNLMLFLPKVKDIEDSNLDELIKEMLGDSIHSLKFSPVEVEELSVPRFKVDYEKTLNDTLKQLGMGKMFEGGFDEMAENAKDLSVGSVAHRAVLEVNEEGTEAAAATAVVMMQEMMRASVKISFNRPFIYALRHEKSDVLAFFGTMLAPSE